jgi:hypothetical protein
MSVSVFHFWLTSRRRPNATKFSSLARSQILAIQGAASRIVNPAGLQCSSDRKTPPAPPNPPQ